MPDYMHCMYWRRGGASQLFCGWPEVGAAAADAAGSTGLGVLQAISQLFTPRTKSEFGAAAAASRQRGRVLGAAGPLPACHASRWARFRRGDCCHAVAGQDGKADCPLWARYAARRARVERSGCCRAEGARLPRPAFSIMMMMGRACRQASCQSPRSNPLAGARGPSSCWSAQARSLVQPALSWRATPRLLACGGGAG